MGCLQGEKQFSSWDIKGNNVWTFTILCRPGTLSRGQTSGDEWRQSKFLYQSVSVSQSAEKVNNKQIACLTSFTQSERIELDMNVKYTQKNFYNALAFTAAFLYPEYKAQSNDQVLHLSSSTEKIRWSKSVYLYDN